MADERIPYVYFAQVRGGGPIKIGSSLGPMERIRQLQSWCPFPLDFLCMIEGDTIEERLLHELQVAFCIHHEWFEPNAALSQIIAHAVANDCLPPEIETVALARREAWWVAERARKEAHDEAWARLRAGELLKAKPPGGRGRPSGFMTGEALERFREKRAAADARRRAAKGHGRTVEFKIVANPLSAAE